jgi:hypothetical protein
MHAPTEDALFPSLDAELAEFEREILQDSLEYQANLSEIEQLEAENDHVEIQDEGWPELRRIARIRAFCRNPLTAIREWMRGRRVDA